MVYALLTEREESMTTTTDPRQPNMFELQGGDVRVSYSTSSIAGVPLFTYEGQGVKRSFKGEEIRAQETEIGVLVTVTIEAVPDFRVVTFSVLIPTINLDGNEAEVKTQGIHTTSRTSIGGPALVKGQVNSYEGVELSGKARAVVF
jgi:hypothetical protein